MCGSYPAPFYQVNFRRAVSRSVIELVGEVVKGVAA